MKRPPPSQAPITCSNCGRKQEAALQAHTHHLNALACKKSRRLIAQRLIPVDSYGNRPTTIHTQPKYSAAALKALGIEARIAYTRDDGRPECWTTPAGENAMHWIQSARISIVYVSIPELARRFARKPGLLERYEAAVRLGCDDYNAIRELLKPLRRP